MVYGLKSHTISDGSIFTVVLLSSLESVLVAACGIELEETPHLGSFTTCTGSDCLVTCLSWSPSFSNTLKMQWYYPGDVTVSKHPAE